jgi:hypothetical protein
VLIVYFIEHTPHALFLVNKAGPAKQELIDGVCPAFLLASYSQVASKAPKKK